MKELSEVIAGYPDGTGIIRYRKDGRMRDWPVGICREDNEESLKRHLKRWIPKAEFVACILNPRLKR
jgi:hypothetical protein